MLKYGLIVCLMLPISVKGQSDTSMADIKIKVDSIMTFAIQEKAFPGAQLLVAKNGQIIFHEAYGYHTYDSIQTVELNDIYDLASITKIMGPLLPLMKLYEEGHIDLDAPFSTYWTSWKRVRDKKNITLRELLAHQAGMAPYIVFLNDVMKSNVPKKRFVRNRFKPRFSKRVSDSLFVKTNYRNRVFRKIKRTEVSTDKKYRYSGLASLIYPQLIEDLTNIPYETYVQTHFYNPLKLTLFGYNPIDKGFTSIVPTERDTVFRKATITGYVHDENAALLGGVSGNAGLFGSAKDLFILTQMLVNKGVYDGQQYLKASTIDEFIKVQYPENGNRRGLGFDKPLLNNSALPLDEAYPAPEVSPQSFGHSGFTGTFVWADPTHNLIFIFLSNRVYPSRTHQNIYKLNIRPVLQQLFYKGLELNKK